MLAIEIYRWPISDCNGFAYKIIQEMNEGQIKKGRAVVKGRVRSDHFEARFFAGDEDARL